MAIFHTSDWHFGHRNIITFCDRPFRSVPHMNEALIQRHNAVVAPEDTVFVHGDVAMGPINDSLDCVSRLNGLLFLVVGNHDRVFRGAKPGNTERRRQWLRTYMEAGFGVVTESHRTSIDGTPVALSHFPYDGDSHDGDRYREWRLPDDGTVLLHGHTHSKEQVSRSKAGTLQIHVGVDAWDYTPVTTETLAGIIAQHQ